ncbi:UNVERIFIED_CONTAM: hypothetical protein NCL1_41848 [Trichonephila clavipes]
MAGVSWVRVLVPMKTLHVEGPMHVKTVEAQNPLLDMMGNNFRLRAMYTFPQIPTMPSSSRVFSGRSSSTALWIFTISGVIASFGRPLRCSTWQLKYNELVDVDLYNK